MNRPVVPGYRYFECEDCGHVWREYCRDHMTPSVSDCPAARGAVEELECDNMFGVMPFFSRPLEDGEEVK